MIHPYKIPLKRLSDNTFPRSLETVSQFVTFTGFRISPRKAEFVRNDAIVIPSMNQLRCTPCADLMY